MRYLLALVSFLVLVCFATPVPPRNMTYVSGANQTAVAGSWFAQTFSVDITLDPTYGCLLLIRRPVLGGGVNEHDDTYFDVTDPGLYQISVRASWAIGSYSIKAFYQCFSRPDLELDFPVTQTEPANLGIAIVSGNNQFTIVNTSYVEMPSVAVYDTVSGYAIGNVRMRFNNSATYNSTVKCITMQGLDANSTVVSDADGVAGLTGAIAKQSAGVCNCNLQATTVGLNKTLSISFTLWNLRGQQSLAFAPDSNHETKINTVHNVDFAARVTRTLETGPLLVTLPAIPYSGIAIEFTSLPLIDAPGQVDIALAALSITNLTAPNAVVPAANTQDVVTTTNSNGTAYVWAYANQYEGINYLRALVSYDPYGFDFNPSVDYAELRNLEDLDGNNGDILLNSTQAPVTPTPTPTNSTSVNSTASANATTTAAPTPTPAPTNATTNSTLMCFGVNATSPLVCSSNGNCTSANVCLCKSNLYSGRKCETCSPDGVSSFYWHMDFCKCLEQGKSNTVCMKERGTKDSRLFALVLFGIGTPSVFALFILFFCVAGSKYLLLMTGNNKQE